MRERPVPCRNATLREFVAGRHRTFNEDAVCDRCAASLPGRARDRGQGAPPHPAPTHLTAAERAARNERNAVSAGPGSPRALR